MLKLLLSEDFVAGRDEILRRVARDVEEEKGNRILMVPELISHDMERRLCFTAGDTSSRFAEVLSFTRLARRVSDAMGCAARECLDNGGRVVAMAAAARQLHSVLKAYASVETRPEFLTGLVDAVDEFKRCCITSEDLKEAAGRTEGAFAQKLEELSLLLEAYDSLCAQGKRDPRDQMTWLLEQLYDGDFGENHVFYIDGFPDFTRQHLAILEYLIKVSPCVTVSLNCDRVGSNEPAFEKAGQTAAALIRCAEHGGVEVKIETLAKTESPLTYLRSRLFQGAVEPREELKDRLLVCRGDSVHRECETAAQRILELVRSGCRYRRIGVVCTDMGAYADPLQRIFNRCGIPSYRAGTEDILRKTVVTTVLSAMDAALGGFERQDVLRYLKSMLSPVKMEDCDLMENYAIIWSVNGSRWLQPWENHPDGLNGEWDEVSRERLAHLEQLRKMALAPLERLRQRFRAATMLSQQTVALCEFFEEISLAQRLCVLAEELDREGDNRGAQILNQLWEILLSALEQLHDVLGHTQWDQETFTRLFTLLLSQYDVGTIPPVLDAVYVGPVTAMRCQEVDHLILLGAQEGALPGYGGSSGVLTDQERDTLRELGVPLTGGGMEGLQAEFADIYGVFCGARQSVLISCGSGQPSFLYRRLAVMAGEERQAEGFLQGADVLDAAAWLSRLRDRDGARELGIEEAFDYISDLRDYRMGHMEPDTVRSLYGRRLRLSASQVDRQAECRLSYFLKYGLRAQERKEASVDPAEFGTYVHAVLEHTAREVMARGGFHQVSLDQTMAIAMAYSEQYTLERFSQLDSQRLTYLFKRNIQELAMVVEELWQELSNSEFTPVEFELAFGDGARMEAIDIPGAPISAQLRGFVDRVDAWSNGYTNYFRVVDYKTGRKDFDYCDVFNGIGLQMLIYLFALEDRGDALLGDNSRSAGVQYFPARSPYLNASGSLDETQAKAERAKSWKRKGLILGDLDVINAMEPQGISRTSCKLTKDGSLTGDIADREQLRLLKEYVFRILRRMVADIASGNVEPNPYTRGSAHDACTYCPYGSICRPDTVEGRRNYKSMTSERFWEEIGREMDRHG